MTVGRPKEFEQDKALDKAIDVFCLKGYEGASTEDLLKAMKLGKGSMYHTFGSKRDLFNQALNRYLDRFLNDFAAELDASPNPIENIKAFFRGIAAESTEEHRKGCFMGNSVTGLAGIDATMSKNAIDKLKSLEEVFFIYIRRAQVQGLLTSKENPKLLARHLITLWNGINITRRMYPDQAILREILELQLSIVH